MRAAALALAALLVAMLLAPATAAEDFGAFGKVSGLIRIRETPQLAPGESGRLAFYFNSTYDEPIEDVRLNASIYHYATIDESIPVDDTWRYPYPRFAESDSRAWSWTAPRLDPDATNLVNLTVLTSASSDEMPHGSIFSQAAYFVRFSLEFTGDLTGNRTRYRMASFGFFTPELWERARVNDTEPCTPPWCRGNVNVTVLGVHGILPDTAFGVKEPIPRWPFYLLIGLAAFFLVLAFLFWVEENPGSYPRVNAWWARTRGRLARLLAPLRRKPPPKT